MKIRERQLVGIAGIRRGPIALYLPQLLELLAQAVAKLSEKTQRLVQVAQFIHQVSLGQVGKTLVAHLRAAREPLAQCAPAYRSDFIDAASRAPPGGSSRSYPCTRSRNAEGRLGRDTPRGCPQAQFLLPSFTVPSPCVMVVPRTADPSARRLGHD